MTNKEDKQTEEEKNMYYFHSWNPESVEDIVKGFDVFIEKYAGGLVGHLLDNDDNDGQFFREAIENVFKAERERVLEEVGETKKDFLARVLGEFHANNLQGKGYDFYFVLAHELNQLNQLKEK